MLLLLPDYVQYVRTIHEVYKCTIHVGLEHILVRVEVILCRTARQTIIMYKIKAKVRTHIFGSCITVRAYTTSMAPSR